MKAASKLFPEFARDRASTLYRSDSRVRQRDELRKPRRAASRRWKRLDRDGDGEEEEEEDDDDDVPSPRSAEDGDEAGETSAFRDASSAGRAAAAAAAISRRFSSSCFSSPQKHAAPVI